MIAVALLVLAVLSFGALMDHAGRSCGRGQSRDFNRQHGQLRVLYNDGELSEPMCRDVATDYADIFGGIVVAKERA